MRPRSDVSTSVPNSRLERRSAVGTAAEQALALYRAIFVKSTEAIAIIDPSGHYLEQNAAHEQLVGYSDEELRGQTPAIHLGEEVFTSITEELAATGVSRRECASRSKDGRQRTIELSAFVVRDANGEPVCYVGIKRDITEERRAAAELGQKLDEQQAVYRMAEAVTRAGDLDDIYDVALAELQRTVRADRASILLFDDDGVMRFKAWRGLSEAYRRTVEGHTPWSAEDTDPQPILVADVEADPSLTTLMPVLRQEGIRSCGFIPLVNAGRLLGKFMIYFNTPHVVGPAELRLTRAIASHVALAISRKRSETALRESEERYRRLVEHSPVAVAVHSGGKVVFVNPACARLVGASMPAEVVGRSMLDFVHPDYHDVVRSRVHRLAAGAGTQPTIEERFVRLDGTPIDVEVSTIGFTFQGRPAVQVVASDVTERKRIEREQRLLAEAGALLNSTLDYQETLRSITRLCVPAIADWCLVDLTDEQGGFTRIAAAGADPDAAVIADRLRRFYPPSDAKNGISRTARAGAPELMSHFDDALLVSVARDAEHLELLRAMRMTSYVCAPLIARGRTIGVLTLALGSSGRRYSDADLPLAQELARRSALAVDNALLYREAREANRAKSQFLTTMSHELRTPLNAIGGYTELIEMGLRGPVTSEMREDLTRIQRSQKHLLGLINDLLNFARIESGHVELNLQSVSVEEELAAVEPLITPQLTAKGLRYQRGAGDAHVGCRADRDKMRQVLLNLLSNAVKFTPADGEVSLAWDATEKTVRIHVSDTGQGIPPHKHEVIFEPFVQLTNTLTRVTEGTGLGLAISRELARAMGGDVTVTSQLGRGSTFTVTLPRVS